MMCLLAFVAGATIEICCVGWVHFSERDRAGATAFCSVLIAIAQVTGIAEAIHGGPGAVAFVAGYGAGTYASVKVKSRYKAIRQTGGRS